MTKKKILSVCGTGGVTSGVIAKRVNEIANSEGIEVDIVNSNVFGMKSQLATHKFDLIITSTRIKEVSEGVPVINCMAFLIGQNEESVIEKILEVLKK